SGSGERAGARTQNLGIKSPLLYQLSYAPGRKLGRGLFPGKIAPASAAGRLDAQAITRCERERGMARDGLDAAVGTLDRVATPRARAAAGEAPGRDAPALAEQRDRQRCERLVAPHEPVAASPAPGSTAAAPQRELEQPHREARLEHFGVGDPRVGHVDVNAARAREA